MKLEHLKDGAVFTYQITNSIDAYVYTGIKLNATHWVCLYRFHEDEGFVTQSMFHNPLGYDRVIVDWFPEHELDEIGIMDAAHAAKMKAILDGHGEDVVNAISYAADVVYADMRADIQRAADADMVANVISAYTAIGVAGLDVQYAACSCDFVTQILPYGCKCGGK